MKTTILLTQLLLNIETLQAFAPSLQRSTFTRQSQPSSTRVFSQWDDEDDEIVSKPTSFDNADVAMKDADEQKRVDEMGDDSNDEVGAVVTLVYSSIELFPNEDSHPYTNYSTTTMTSPE